MHSVADELENREGASRSSTHGSEPYDHRKYPVMTREQRIPNPEFRPLLGLKQQLLHHQPIDVGRDLSIGLRLWFLRGIGAHRRNSAVGAGFMQSARLEPANSPFAGLRRHTVRMTENDNLEGVARLEAGMPYLSVDASLRAKRQLGHVLGVAAPREPKGRQIVDGLIRLSDKSISEYAACRERLLLFLRQGHANDLYRAQDHFESCVLALHRAINFLDRLRSLGYRTSDGQPLVARPRDLAVLRDDVRGRVRRLRDLLEHLEDDIVGDRIPPSSPAQLHLGWELAVLEGAELAYKDLAEWCTDIHRIVAPLAQVTLVHGPGVSQSP